MQLIQHAWCRVSCNGCWSLCEQRPAAPGAPALKGRWILAVRVRSTQKQIHYPCWLFWSILTELWKTDKAITFMLLKCMWWWQAYINSANKVHFPFSALVLHSDLQKSPTGNRENNVQKREVVLVNRCWNICSFFLQVFVKQLQIKITLFDYNVLYIILCNWSYCIPLAAQNKCQLPFAGLEMYIFVTSFLKGLKIKAFSFSLLTLCKWQHN